MSLEAKAKINVVMEVVLEEAVADMYLAQEVLNL
jgi:hypothetical protein